MLIRLKVLMFLNYFICAIGTTQLIPYISYLGFDQTSKSYILATIAVFTILLQFLSGIFSDVIKKIKVVFLFIYFGYLLSNCLLFTYNDFNFLVCLIIVGIVGGCYRCSQGLLDSWVIQLEKENYSVIRAFGALGWGIGSILLANIIERYGYDVIPVMLFLVGILSVILSLFVSDSKREKTKLSIYDFKKVIKNKKYMLFIWIVLLLYSLGCADMYIVVDKIIAIGGNKWIVGMKWGLQSLFEIPILLVGNRLLKKHGVFKLMIFASMMFLFRFIIYAWIQIPVYFIYVSFFQLLTFPIVVFCSKEEFDNLVDEQLKTTAQMFAMSIYMGISLFMMPIICNLLVKYFGYDISLYIVSLMSIFAIICLCIYKKMDKIKQKM